MSRPIIRVGVENAPYSYSDSERIDWHASWSCTSIERCMAQVANLSRVDVGAPHQLSDAPVPRPSWTPRRGEILLIEDRDEVREGLAQLLELHGFMVTEVADGDRGMRELAAKPNAFALVVLDLLLGESMAGVDFRLRQLIDPHLAAVPTIVITATEVADEARAPLRPEAWLEKPFRFDALLELVKRYVVAEGSGLIASD